MTQEQQIVLWGAASLAPALLNWITGRSADARGIAGMIFGCWLFERLLWMVVEPHAATHLYPIIDAAMGTVIFAKWWTDRRIWKLAIVALLLTQCLAHLAWIMTGSADDSFLRYLSANNGLYIPQLLFAGSPGIGHALGVSYRWVRRLAGRPAHVGA